MTSPLVLLLLALGSLTLLRLLHATFHFLTFHLILPARPLSAYQRPSHPRGAHALVTGASAGIGLGIARALARCGFHVILHGHLPAELAAAAASLRAAYPAATVRTLVLDARTASGGDIDAALRRLEEEGVCVSVLVNNVGGIPVAEPAVRGLGTFTAGEVDAVVDMNARFMARVTAGVMRRFFFVQREAEGGGRSLVLSVGSAAGRLPVPWLALYSATKAFNAALSEAVAREMEAEGRAVDCLAVVPGEVRSQGNCRGVPGWAPGWEEYGGCVVRKVDGAVARGWREMRPFWRHDLEMAVVGWLPRGVVEAAVREAGGRKREAWKGGKREAWKGRKGE